VDHYNYDKGFVVFVFNFKHKTIQLEFN